MMNFLIADTFSSALSKLSAQEQKAVKITVFDLQQDPSSSSLQFHRVDKSKDANFWSIRVNLDIRVIVHKTDKSFLVCYVDHHDDAYKWAERRRIDTHPRTGAAQIVEVRERVEEYTSFRDTLIDTAIASPQPSKDGDVLPFSNLQQDDMLDVGVPEDWVSDVLRASEDRFLDLATHLPGEASEALLEYISTGILTKAQASTEGTSAFDHPDALRRFRVMENIEELELALEYPWDKWILYLHPSQQSVVERDFTGPARVSGSAGTGKTVVALHRVKRILDEDPSARPLLTTFSEPLASNLSHKLECLVGDKASRVSVASFMGVAKELFVLVNAHDPHPANDAHIKAALQAANKEVGDTGFSDRFLLAEWNHVVDAWQIGDLEAYATVPRLGRKNRLGTKQRERVWPIFERARQLLSAQGRQTWPEIFASVTNYFGKAQHKPFSHVVVDEAQDLGVPELRMLSQIVGTGNNNLFFAGDLGQRIFQEPFSWKQLGIDIRGRSSTLKVNYRTSHQIRETVDLLLPATVRDVDGNQEDRKGTVSVFNGPRPEIKLACSDQEELSLVCDWLRKRLDEGVVVDEIGIFVREASLLNRPREVAKRLDLSVAELSARFEDRSSKLAIGTMHLAKGLEFKAVIVMACDEGILPDEARLAAAADETEMDNVYDTERHLLYVACTRARDHLLITAIEPGSEFLEDLSGL